MDRDELSEAIIQDFGDSVAEERRAARSELLRADRAAVEGRLHALMRRVGGATRERVRAARAVPRGERPPCRGAEGRCG